MTTDATAIALGAILDSLTLVQAQLDALTDAGQRIEATHEVSAHSSSETPIRSPNAV